MRATLALNRFKQLKIRPRCISENSTDFFQIRVTCGCNTLELSNYKMLFMETRPNVPEGRCFSTILGRDKRLYPSSILSNSQGSD